MRFTPAATASFTKATCSGVLVSRFVPSPIRATSVSPSLSFGLAFVWLILSHTVLPEADRLERHDPAESLDDVKKLNVHDLAAFYAKWYMPNNAILIVAGDTTADQVRKLGQVFGICSDDIVLDPVENTASRSRPRGVSSPTRGSGGTDR